MQSKLEMYELPPLQKKVPAVSSSYHVGGEVGEYCPVSLVQLLLQKQVTEGSPECHSVPQP